MLEKLFGRQFYFGAGGCTMEILESGSGTSLEVVTRSPKKPTAEEVRPALSSILHSWAMDLLSTKVAISFQTQQVIPACGCIFAAVANASQIKSCLMSISSSSLFNNWQEENCLYILFPYFQEQLS